MNTFKQRRPLINQSFVQTLAVLGVFSSGFWSCADDFKKISQLGELRVLGIVASAPEISPGQNVTVEPLISYPNKTDTEVVEHQLSYCVDPGTDLGVEPSCDGVTGRVVLLDWSVVAFASSSKTEKLGALGTVSAANTLLTGLTDAQKTQGVKILIDYRIQVRGQSDTLIRAVRKVLVTDSTLVPTKSTNPATPSVEADGVTFSQFGDKESEFVAEGVGEEDLVSWYVSTGELNSARTLGSNSNTWTPSDSGSTSSTTKQVLVVVVRNSSGGLNYKIVEEP